MMGILRHLMYFSVKDWKVGVLREGGTANG